MVLMKIGNTLIGWLLHSPLHGLMSRTTMLISFTGRRSGKRYTTPVGYTQTGNLIRTTSQRNRVWWRNFEGSAPVKLTLRGKNRSGTATALTEESAVADGLTAFLTSNPQMAKYFKVGFGEDNQPNPEDLARAVKERVVIEIRLEG